MRGAFSSIRSFRNHYQLRIQNETEAARNQSHLENPPWDLRAALESPSRSPLSKKPASMIAYADRENYSGPAELTHNHRPTG
jgi:hypothetical protein